MCNVCELILFLLLIPFMPSLTTIAKAVCVVSLGYGIYTLEPVPVVLGLSLIQFFEFFEDKSGVDH